MVIASYNQDAGNTATAQLGHYIVSFRGGAARLVLEMNEIGLRKAVGATPAAILTQFLIEAIILSLVGGSIGIAIGTLGATILRQFIQTSVSIWSVTLAFGFSALVGIVFGVAPAIRAARLNPIDALRYE